MRLLTVINQVKIFIFASLISEHTSTISVPVPKLCDDQQEEQTAEREEQTYDCNIQLIHCLIKTLNWRRLYIIFSRTDEMVASVILHSFDKSELGPPQTSLWDVTKMTRKGIFNLLSNMYGDGYDEIRIIILLNNDTLEFLQVGDTFDDLSNKSTNYRTNSKWIIWDRLDMPSANMDSSLKLRDVIYVKSCKAFSVLNNQTAEVDCFKSRPWTFNCECPNGCSSEHIFPRSMFKLNGRHLSIGTLNNVYFGDIVNELSRTIAQALNFTYTFHKPTDRQYGNEINGSWTGMVGQLQRRDVDLVVEELTVTEERMKVVDFILPGFLSQKFGILYRRGVEMESAWTKIFTPLRADVYWCILATLCFVAGLLYLLDNIVDPGARFCFIRLFNVVVDLVGFLSIRGSGLSPRTQSARVMVAAFWMFCVVVTGVYIGNLTAKITETREKKPFDSIEELVQTDWKWGVTNGGLSMQMIRSSKVKSIQELWKGVVKFNKTDSRVTDSHYDNHFRFVLDTSWKYAYIVLDPKFYSLNRNDCRMATTEAHIISNLQLALAVPKHSYLKPELERVMARLLDNGFISSIRDMRYKDNRPWTCKYTPRIRTTNLEDVQGLLLVVCIGLGVALVVLILEWLSYRAERR